MDAAFARAYAEAGIMPLEDYIAMSKQEVPPTSDPYGFLASVNNIAKLTEVCVKAGADAEKANSDILRKRERQLEAALAVATEFIEELSDTVDGPNGPEPNAAMSTMNEIRAILGWIP